MATDSGESRRPFGRCDLLVEQLIGIRLEGLGQFEHQLGRGADLPFSRFEMACR